MIGASVPSSLANLDRLASKPGVQSTLLLSKIDGAIIRSTGLLSDVPDASDIPNLGKSVGSERGLLSGTASRDDDSFGRDRKKEPSATDVARMIYQFVSTAGALVSELDSGDDVQLMRLRTRKSEIVIVPDARFLLVVFHEPAKTS